MFGHVNGIDDWMMNIKYQITHQWNINNDTILYYYLQL